MKLMTQPYLARSAPPRFSGELLTRECGKSWLKGHQLLELAAQDTDSYVGEMPDTKMKKETLLARLEHLADFIQGLGKCMPSILTQWLQQFPLPHGLEISYLDSGEFGHVFKVSVGQQHYAFKVLRQGTVDEIAEIANGAYLTAKTTRDLARFHLGNVEKVWYLAEMIDQNSMPLVQRSGKTIEEQGFRFMDHDSADSSNRINGIRVDYGCMQKLDIPPVPKLTWLGKKFRQLCQLFRCNSLKEDT